MSFEALDVKSVVNLQCDVVSELQTIEQRLLGGFLEEANFM